jgi:RNA polymerase sigma factor (sigma-70 family)
MTEKAYSSLANDPEYRNAPTRPEELVDLESWVAMYLAGSEAHRKLIIKAHLHLVASIARSMAKRYKRMFMLEDMTSEALLHLTQAVEDAKTALTDYAITPYITTSVRYRLKDFVAEDRNVFMPGRTFRHKAANGEINFEGDNLNSQIIGVVSITRAVRESNMKEDDSGGFIRLNVGRPYFIPEAKPCEPSPEFQEALQLAIHTDQERRIIDLRAEGYGYTDFESVMGLKKSRIGQIVKRVEERFVRSYA